MECNLKNRNELITNYLTGELPEGEAKAFEQHYFQCEICFNELRVAEDAINLIKNEGHSLLSHQQKDRSFISKILTALETPKGRKISWGVATAVVTSILIFILFLPSPENQPVINDKIIIADKDSSNLLDTTSDEQKEQQIQREKDIKDQNLIADLTGPTFEADPYMEEWISEKTRSSEIFDTVLSPQIGEKYFNEAILFRWELSNKKMGSVNLKIINNTDKEIYKSSPDISKLPSVTAQVKAEIFKEAGLYYWKIENENEVLYVGKFYFLK